MAAAAPLFAVTSTLGGISPIAAASSALGLFSTASQLFGGQDEAPSLPPPPPMPEVAAPPPPPKQVTSGAQEAVAAEQARTRSIRQRRSASQRRGITSTDDSSRAPTLLGD